MSDKNPGTKAVDLMVRRVFSAPVSEVWRAWTHQEYVMRWWGPAGFTSPRAEMDVRVGGTSLVCMSAPGYGEMYNTWHYTRIEPMQLIEFILNFADRDGNALDPATLGIPDVPKGVRHLVTMREVDNARTELTVTEHGYLSQQAADISKTGLEECLDKMAAIWDDEEKVVR